MYGSGSVVGHWPWNQYLSLVNKLVFGAHSLWRDTLLSLDTTGEGYGPASSDVTDFVESPWEVSCPLRSGWGIEWAESGRSGRTARRGNRDRYKKQDCLKKEEKSRASKR